MNVENALNRNVQHFLAQDLTVSYGDHHVGREGRELIHHPRIPQRRRLKDRNTELLGDEFDRSGSRVAASPSGAIRLGNHRADAETAGGEPSQARDGECGCANEYDAHRRMLDSSNGSRAILAWRRSNAKRVASVIQL